MGHGASVPSTRTIRELCPARQPQSCRLPSMNFFICARRFTGANFRAATRGASPAPASGPAGRRWRRPWRRGSSSPPPPSRPSGSPRLITRLRRLKEIELSRAGMITLVDSARGPEEPLPPPAASAPPAETSAPPPAASPPPPETPAPSTHDAALSETVAEAAAPVDGYEDEGPQPGNERIESAPPPSDDGSARRRRRRGGRRWRGRGRPQPTASS